MDDDDDFDVFAKIDSIVEQHLQTKVSNKRNVSPQSTDKFQPANRNLAERSSWQQPAHGSQPPPGLVHHSDHGPTNGQQQGPRGNQAARGAHAAVVEPQIYSVQAGPQNGYSSAPKNVFADAVPSTGAPALQRPLKGAPHARPPHAPWLPQQPRPTAQATAAHPMGSASHASATRPPHAAGIGPGRPGMPMSVARPGRTQEIAPPSVSRGPIAVAGRGGTAPGLQAASSAGAPGGMPHQRPLSSGFGAGYTPGQLPAKSAAAQPRPLELQSPIRGGPAASAAPSSLQPTNSLVAAQLAGAEEALPELTLATTLDRLQRERDELQRRLNDNEGQNALLRARVERAERERLEVQTRISQASQGGLTAATLADTQRKLDTALKELAFKEQEAAEVQRRNADRDARLKAADAQAAALAAEAKRLEQQRTQLEAELAEAHRERRERAADASTSGAGNEVLRSPGAGRRSLSPRNWQQQQQQQLPSAAARKLVRAPAGSAARSATASAGQKRRLSGATAAAGPSSHSGEHCNSGRSSQPPILAIPAEPIHERTTWHSAASPSGIGSLWQSLSAACGASLAALLAERGGEGTSPESTADEVVRQARLLAWGVDSAGPALLCALCSALAAEHQRTNDQASQLDIRWRCAMLDVLSALLRLCRSCQALALASLVPSGQLPAAPPVPPTGLGPRVQLHKPANTAGGSEVAASSGALGLEALVLVDAASTSNTLPPLLNHLRGLRLGNLEACGRGVLGVLLGTLMQTDSACASFLCTLHAVAALTAVAPPLDRAVMSPILTSGVLEKAASQKLAFLQVLHLLLECPAVCDLLEASLAAQAAQGQGADAELAASADAQLAASAADASAGVQGNPDEGGGTERGTKSWSGCWNIFQALNNCLSAAPAATKATAGPLQGPANDCPYQVPRRALLVLALCMEAGRYGLLLPLLSEEAGSPSLVQRLVILVDDVTRSPEGGLLQALAAQPRPATVPEARRWQVALRVVQEALTLLRGLSAAEHLRELVLEEHLASPAATRLCHVVVGRIVQLRPLPARLLRSAAPLPLAPWAHAVGASSVTRSVCVSTDSADGSPGGLPVATVEDVTHLAKGLLRRVQERLPVLMQP
ncbi:g5476 [Coccomyxa elongata]